MNSMFIYLWRVWRKFLFKKQLKDQTFKELISEVPGMRICNTCKSFIIAIPDTENPLILSFKCKCK